MRLIDADAMRAYFKAIPFGDLTGNELNWVLRIYDAIDNAPTIDAEPVRRGKWMYHRISVPKGKGQTYSVYGCWLCHAHVRKRTLYCPDCGAKMDLEGEHD